MTRTPLRGDALRQAVADDRGSVHHVYQALGLEVGTGWLAEILDTGRTPSMPELARIAAVANVPLTVLSGLRDPKSSLAIALRAGIVERDTELAVSTDRAYRLIKHYSILASWYRSVDESRRQSYARVRRACSFDRYVKRAAQETAQNVRSILNLDDFEPISDLAKVVESVGVPVVVTDLPDNVHGLTAHDSAGGHWRAVVLVNRRDWWTRQRFTLAHELAHLLYQDGDSLIVDHKGDVDGLGAVELRAECFARYLLIPDAAVRQFWSENRRDGLEVSLARLMLHFGVSRDAAVRAVAEVCNVPRSRLAPLLGDANRVRDMMDSAGMLDEWLSLCRDQHEEGASSLLLDLALNGYRDKIIPSSVVADVLNESDLESVELQLLNQGWNS